MNWKYYNSQEIPNSERVDWEGLTTLSSQWCSKVMIGIDPGDPKFREDERGEESF